jgi:hypothetical protein
MCANWLGSGRVRARVSNGQEQGWPRSGILRGNVWASNEQLPRLRGHRYVGRLPLNWQPYMAILGCSLPICTAHLPGHVVGQLYKKRCPWRLQSCHRRATAGVASNRRGEAWQRPAASRRAHGGGPKKDVDGPAPCPSRAQLVAASAPLRSGPRRLQGMAEVAFLWAGFGYRVG